MGSQWCKALGKFDCILRSVSLTTGVKLLKKIYIERLQQSVHTLQKMKQI